MVPVHRFGRSRIVSAPPAARTDHGLFKARTPARPEGASFGAAGLITGGVVYLGDFSARGEARVAPARYARVAPRPGTAGARRPPTPGSTGAGRRSRGPSAR